MRKKTSQRYKLSPIDCWLLVISEQNIVISKNICRKTLLSIKGKHTYTPLAGLILASCGSDTGGSGDSASGSNLSTIQFPIFGNAIKGPLQNAVAFADEDGDGVQGPGEASAVTSAVGFFSFNASGPGTKVIVKTTESTIDTSSGQILSGVTLSAPPGSKVISPASTILEAQPDIEPEQLAIALGVPTTAADGTPIDLLNFNPFSPDADPEAALAVEKAGQQVMVTVQAVSAAAEGAGMSVEQAFKQAMESVSEVVSEAAATIDVSSPAAISAAESAIASGATKKIDMSDTSFLDSVSETAKEKVAEAATADSSIVINKEAFNSVIDIALSSTSSLANALESISKMTNIGGVSTGDVNPEDTNALQSDPENIPEEESEAANTSLTTTIEETNGVLDNGTESNTSLVDSDEDETSDTIKIVTTTDFSEMSN